MRVISIYLPITIASVVFHFHCIVIVVHKGNCNVIPPYRASVELSTGGLGT